MIWGNEGGESTTFFIPTFSFMIHIQTPLDTVFCLVALTDSGAESNFIDKDTTEKPNLPVCPLGKPLQLWESYTQPVQLQVGAMNLEQISLPVTVAAKQPIIQVFPYYSSIPKATTT